MTTVNDKEKYLEVAPADWERTSIGDLFKFSSGKSRPKDIRKKRSDEFCYPVYGGNGILGYSKEYCFENSYLILGRVGEYCGCAHITEDKSWISDNALYSKDVLSDIDYEYFKFFFDYFDLNRFSNKNGQPLITQGNIASLQIAKPKVTEQRQIGSVLKTIQKAIQNQEQIINSTTALKKTLLHKVFTEGLNGEKSEMSSVGVKPKSWKQLPLDKTGEVIYGIQAAVANNTKPDGTLILTNINITLDGEIDLTKKRYYKLKSKRDLTTILEKGDLLFNWRSGSRQHVGKTALFDLDGEYTHSSFILRIRPNEKVDNYYLYLYLNYLRQSGYFTNNQDFMVNAKFNKSAIENLPVLLPEKDEQVNICDAIKAIDRKMKFHTKKLFLYNSLFSTMLNGLMTGGIRVHDIEFLSKLASAAEEEASPKSITA